MESRLLTSGNNANCLLPSRLIASKCPGSPLRFDLLSAPFLPCSFTPLLPSSLFLPLYGFAASGIYASLRPSFRSLVPFLSRFTASQRTGSTPRFDLLSAPYLPCSLPPLLLSSPAIRLRSERDLRCASTFFPLPCSLAPFLLCSLFPSSAAILSYN